MNEEYQIICEARDNGGIAYALYFGGERRGAAVKDVQGRVSVHWLAVGPFSVRESWLWHAGIFELLTKAEELNQPKLETINERKAKRAARRARRLCHKDQK